jgi:hypothetical protein
LFTVFHRLSVFLHASIPQWVTLEQLRFVSYGQLTGGLSPPRCRPCWSKKKKRDRTPVLSLFHKIPDNRKLILLLVLLLQVLQVLLLLVLLVLLERQVLLLELLQVLLQVLQFFLRSPRKKLSLKERGK